jgi:hypothetical protein
MHMPMADTLQLEPQQSLGEVDYPRTERLAEATSHDRRRQDRDSATSGIPHAN